MSGSSFARISFRSRGKSEFTVVVRKRYHDYRLMKVIICETLTLALIYTFCFTFGGCENLETQNILYKYK